MALGHRGVFRFLAAAGAGCIAGGALAQPAVQPYQEVKDLHYGQVLYHFFQDQYFSSLTHLLVARERDHLQHHQDEAELLLGGLYLSYGLNTEAEKIFERLVDKLTAPPVRNRAWFQLAEIFYQRGRPEEAKRALLRMEDALPPDLRARRALLLGNIHMGEGQFESAVQVLNAARGTGMWNFYAQFNLGIALLKSGNLESGVMTLTDVGRLEATDAESKALRDRANLAAGFALLDVKQPKRATDFFSEVRLEGPFSNQALYGMATAHEQMRMNRASLKYWDELRQRSKRSPGVLDAMMTVPQALFRMQAYPQAISALESTIAAYNEEIAGLDRSIQALQETRLFEDMLAMEDTDERQWAWRPAALPPALQHHHITDLLASHRFNEALKNYRHLQFFRAHLEQRSRDMAIYDRMLAARQQAFEAKLPGVMSHGREVERQDAESRFQHLQAEFNRIEQDEHAMGLATDVEKAQLARLEHVRQRLEKLSAAGSPDDYADQWRNYRLMRGKLLWSIETDFHPRLQQTRNNLQELERLVDNSDEAHTALSAAQISAPEQFRQLRRRIETLDERTTRLQRRVDQLLAEQERVIKGSALARLQGERDRLADMLVRAEFAKAQILDLVANQQQP